MEACRQYHQRVRYSDGQLLRARDLQEDYLRERWLLQLHTAGLHQAWGIALGLTVALGADQRHMEVSPGLAYDCRGRELILAETENIDLPVGVQPDKVKATAAQPDHISSCDLVLFFDKDDPADNCLYIDPLCAKAAELRLERPRLAWRQIDQVRPGLDLRLARALFSGEKIVLSSCERRYAQPMRRPTFAAGRTPSGATWGPWPHAGDQPPGKSIMVDTSGADFVRTPCYFAALAGISGNSSGLLGPFTFIEGAQRDQFTFVVLYAAPDGQPDAMLDRGFQTDQWQVSWIGVELI